MFTTDLMGDTETASTTFLKSVASPTFLIGLKVAPGGIMKTGVLVLPITERELLPRKNLPAPVTPLVPMTTANGFNILHKASTSSATSPILLSV